MPCNKEYQQLLATLPFPDKLENKVEIKMEKAIDRHLAPTIIATGSTEAGTRLYSVQENFETLYK